MTKISKEKDFENYIEQNIQPIFDAIVDPVRYATHIRQKPVSFISNLGGSRAYSKGVIDLLVTAKDGNRYIIEVKCTNNVYDLTHGLTQLLMYREYYRHTDHEDAKLILLSDHPEDIIMKLIDEYALPIKLAYVAKDLGIVYVGAGIYEEKK